MKKTLSILALCLSVALPSIAGSVTVSNILDNVSVNNTTNYGTPVFVGYAYVQNMPTFDIYQRGMTATNAAAYTLATGLGTNATNYTLSGTTLFFSVTNAAHLQIPPSQLRVPIYATVITVTTNNVTNVVQAIFQTP